MRTTIAGGPGQNGVSDDKLTIDECGRFAENLQAEPHMANVPV
jgi:hypothetical protein